MQTATQARSTIPIRLVPRATATPAASPASTCANDSEGRGVHTLA